MSPTRFVCATQHSLSIQVWPSSDHINKYNIHTTQFYTILHHTSNQHKHSSFHTTTYKVGYLTSFLFFITGWNNKHHSSLFSISQLTHLWPCMQWTSEWAPHILSHLLTTVVAWWCVHSEIASASHQMGGGKITNAYHCKFSLTSYFHNSPFRSLTMIFNTRLASCSRIKSQPKERVS